MATTKTFTELFGRGNTIDTLIDTSVANYRKLLEEHFKEFTAEAVQTALGRPEFMVEQFEILRRRVEIFSKLIVRPRVKVNRSRSPQDAIDATVHEQSCINREVVKSMPKGNPSIDGDEVDVFYFKLEPWERVYSNYLSYDEIEKALKRRNLTKDFMAAIAVNEADSAFADEYPNNFMWMDSDDRLCRVSFYSRDNVPIVELVFDNHCGANWWIPGVPMPAKAV